jgi:hypothetical protein
MVTPPKQFTPRRSYTQQVERAAKMEKHVRLLTDVRDRLRAAMAQAGPPLSTPVSCRPHGVPWTACAACSKPRTP